MQSDWSKAAGDQNTLAMQTTCADASFPKHDMMIFTVLSVDCVTSPVADLCGLSLCLIQTVMKKLEDATNNTKTWKHKVAEHEGLLRLIQPGNRGALTVYQTASVCLYQSVSVGDCWEKGGFGIEVWVLVRFLTASVKVVLCIMIVSFSATD